MERIWAGERNRQALCTGLSGKTERYIGRLLGHIGSGRDADAWERARESVERRAEETATMGHEASDREAVQELVIFTGKSEEQVRLCLQAADGNREAAAAMLLT